MCVFLQMGGGGRGAVAWLLCRLQEIRLDLRKEPAKEAIPPSCSILSRWERGWLDDTCWACGKTCPGGGLKALEQHKCIRSSTLQTGRLGGNMQMGHELEIPSRAVIGKGRYNVQLPKCDKRIPQTI